MTLREFYNAIINDAITEDVKAEAQERINRLDSENAKRAAKNNEKRLQKTTAILKAMDAFPDGAFASEIADHIGVNTSGVTTYLRYLVEDGKLTREFAKRKNEAGKTSTAYKYTLA